MTLRNAHTDCYVRAEKRNANWNVLDLYFIENLFHTGQKANARKKRIPRNAHCTCFNYLSDKI